MRNPRAALVVMLVLLAPACRKESDSHSNGPRGGPPPPTTSSAEASVPPGASPPVGLVWNIGFTENVGLDEMQSQYEKFVQLSQDLWTVTEGQVCLSQVRFFDAVAPGRSPSTSESLRVPNLDVVIYSSSKWDILPVAGQVIFFSPSGTLGRTDRRIDVPEDARRLTLLHEGSHFAWKLSWRGNNLPPGLDDEYNYDPPDSACIMDLQFSPLRWCSGGSLPSSNHLPKNGGQEATSCWEQILKDYPGFHFGGSSTTPTPLPPLSVEYNDDP
jgi:hypothetical protein